MLSTTEDCNDNVNTKTVLHTDDVQPFIYRCALHLGKTRLHKMLSLIRALWGRMKIPPWLKKRSTGAEVAGTQYIELTNGRRHLNWSLLMTVFTLAFGVADAETLAGQPMLKRFSSCKMWRVNRYWFYWSNIWSNTKVRQMAKCMTGLEKYSRPILRDQDRQRWDQDQDCQKPVSRPRPRSRGLQDWSQLALNLRVTLNNALG